MYSHTVDDGSSPVETQGASEKTLIAWLKSSRPSTLFVAETEAGGQQRVASSRRASLP